MTSINKNNPNSKINLKKGMKISILGAAKSGIHAAKLSKTIDAKVLISDINIKKSDIKLNNVIIETGRHTNKVLESDLIIKSPGIYLHQ